MKYQGTIDKLRLAVIQDKSIIVPKDEIQKTLGQDPRWLAELGLEKGDLLRLERLGFAVKARYEIDKTKEHRVRWIIFSEALSTVQRGNQ